MKVLKFFIQKLRRVRGRALSSYAPVTDWTMCTGRCMYVCRSDWVLSTYIVCRNAEEDWGLCRTPSRSPFPRLELRLPWRSGFRFFAWMQLPAPRRSGKVRTGQGTDCRRGTSQNRLLLSSVTVAHVFTTILLVADILRMYSTRMRTHRYAPIEFVKWFTFCF